MPVRPATLEGLPIAITGASAGIGRATALACARAGMPVALGARRVDRLDTLAAEIRAMGGRAEVIACDVADRASCEGFVAQAERALGPVYAVFANAGYGVEGRADEMPEDEIERLLRTNFWGTAWVVRAATPGMRARGRGHVLICSSCLSKIGLPGYFAYSASKAMQDHFGRALRHELAPAGVFVSTVHPIGTRTEFSGVVTQRSGGSRSTIQTPERWKQPPERVSDAVVACLRRPRGEVWTSRAMRWGLALATAMPGLADRVLARRSRRRASGG
ncbi:MAG: SDR family oxidoreductase [Phycisphaeraceae bacterium]|nr:MAG: SDR family oxidoreductase [Phycisphaeraceae bacterium]